jgi:hypothetical protein
MSYRFGQHGAKLFQFETNLPVDACKPIVFSDLCSFGGLARVGILLRNDLYADFGEIE